MFLFFRFEFRQDLFKRQTALGVTKVAILITTLGQRAAKLDRHKSTKTSLAGGWRWKTALYGGRISYVKKTYISPLIYVHSKTNISTMKGNYTTRYQRQINSASTAGKSKPLTTTEDQRAFRSTAGTKESIASSYISSQVVRVPCTSAIRARSVYDSVLIQESVTVILVFATW